MDRLPLGRLFDVAVPAGVLGDGTYAAAVRSGRPDRRPMFSRFTEDGVVWVDGEEEPLDVVLLATGYRPNLGYLEPLGVLRADGRPDQRAALSSPARAHLCHRNAEGAWATAEAPAILPTRRPRDVGPAYESKWCCGLRLP